jgi:hypothetical protein
MAAVLQIARIKEIRPNADPVSREAAASWATLA